MDLDVLGFNNLAIAVFVDMMKDIFGELPNMTIVKNIPDEKNIYKEYPYKLEDDVIKVIDEDDWTFDPDKKLLIGAAAGKTLHTIYHHFKAKYPLNDKQFINLVHPSAYVAGSVKMGVGVSIEPLSSVSSLVTLNDHVQIKRNVSIGHHSVIGSFTNINPGVNIAGRCKIGDRCLIGLGAKIISNISIGENCVIGAGSVVVKDVPPNTVAYGVPAKFVRHNV